jgi:hypothetical protein
VRGQCERSSGRIAFCDKEDCYRDSHERPECYAQRLAGVRSVRLPESMSSRRPRESIPPSAKDDKMKKFVCILLAAVSLLAGMSAVSLSRAVPVQGAEGALNWGANIAGLGMGGRNDGYHVHGTYGEHYRKNTSAEIAYLHSKGFDYHRVQFMWYRVQHDLYAGLDSTDLGYLDDVVTMVSDQGMQCSIVPFDYGWYYDVSEDTYYSIGTEQVPTAAFADLWTKLATHFKGKVWAYDLINEPRQMTGGFTAWFDASQAAINAIRAVDTTTPIIVPGYAWSSTWYWYQNGNDGLKNLVDPSNNLIFEGHQYFDGDTTGTYTTGDTITGYTGEPEDRAEPLLQPFVEWCRANNKVGLIGEMGTPGTDFWLSVLRPALDYLVECDDAIKYMQMQSCWTCNDQGYSWKDNYIMSVAPYGSPFGADNCNGAERAQTLLLAEYVGYTYTGTIPDQVDAFASSGTWTCPAGVTDVVILVVAGGGSGGYNYGGGGGAGGVLSVPSHVVTPSQEYSVVVGAGGASVSSAGPGNNGSNSSFDGVVAIGGGGGGGGGSSPGYNGRTGGSGGGGGLGSSGAAGSGTEGQGHDGASKGFVGAGGGGAGGRGLASAYGSSIGYSFGGGGKDYSAIFGTARGDGGFFGGGGGGAATSAPGYSPGGKGGGGDGSVGSSTAATGGTSNTGGGGGGSFGAATGASGAGGSGIVLIGYDVSSTNRAPVLNAIGDKSIDEGTTLTFTVAATDADGDTLTYSVSNLPAGAAFSPATRVFSWTPTDGQAGVYANVHFEVSDGSLADTEDITVTVGDEMQADVNGDGSVNSLDMIRVGQHWSETGASGWIPEDINEDGTVNVLDATLIGQHWTG